MSEKPLRIAILECDTPLEHTRSKYGGYGGVFKALLEAGAESLAQETKSTAPVKLDITKFDVVATEEYPNLDHVDAVLLTGSRKSIDSTPWTPPFQIFLHADLPFRDPGTSIVLFAHATKTGELT